MARELDGRVVVVTGAGRGLGREHALLLAREGAHLVVNDLGAGRDGQGADRTPAHDIVDQITAAGGHAVASTDDVADPAGAQRLVDTAVEAFGDLHGIVSNAGILRDRVLVNMTDDDWRLSVRVNLDGTFFPVRAAARYWRERGKAGHDVAAAVVNTSSEAGVFSNAGQSNYVAAKSAVASLTEVWHKELGRYGIRVNAILPRARTRLTNGVTPGARSDGSFDKWDPANVSPFVAYLLTKSCPLSGEVFLVAGSRVQRAAPWRLDPTWRLDGDGRWEVDGLHHAVSARGVPADPDRDTGMIKDAPVPGDRSAR